MPAIFHADVTLSPFFTRIRHASARYFAAAIIFHAIIDCLPPAFTDATLMPA